MKKWRLLTPSTQVMVDRASGALAFIRDTCADGVHKFHWSVIPLEESLPIAAGRTDGFGRARSIAEEALRACAADFDMLTEVTAPDLPILWHDRAGYDASFLG
jgi:hypothetical protein